jgi:predicted chitinase
MKHLKNRDLFLNEQTYGDLIQMMINAGSGKIGNLLDPSGASGSASAPVTADAKKVYAEIEKAMDRHGITNKNARSAIQGVIGKESGWTHLEETNYSGTSNDRIKSVFGKRVSSLSDGELTALKSNSTKFWDRVYGVDDPTGTGRKYGNTMPGDGEKYKGRGVNGLTFKSNYQAYNEVLQRDGKLQRSVDIVANPQLLSSDPEVAAEVAVLFFLEGAKSPLMRSKYGTNDLNALPDLKTAVTAMTNINAGLGSDLSGTVGTEGLARAMATSQKIDSGQISVA